MLTLLVLGTAAMLNVSSACAACCATGGIMKQPRPLQALVVTIHSGISRHRHRPLPRYDATGTLGSSTVVLACQRRGYAATTKAAAAGAPQAARRGRQISCTSSSRHTERHTAVAAAAAEAAAAAAAVSGGSERGIISQPPGALQASSVAVFAGPDGSSDELERCRRLANDLGVALVVEGREEGGAGAGREGDFRFSVLFDERGRLALGQPGSGFNPLVVDFLGGKTGHRAKHQQGTEQVVKAAALPKRRRHAPGDGGPSSSSGNGGEERAREDEGGVSPESGDGNEETPLLWDLTAGLGTDAFVLASAGWRVEMFERSPVVAALVQDALDRARACDDEDTSTAASRMSLTVADSTDRAAARAAASTAEEREGGAARRPEVVYLDPMFPRRKKSALVKKGMQMLQGLLEEEGESEARGARHDRNGDCSSGGGSGGGGDDGARGGEERKLFDVAMSLATCKVVVKRPVHGDAIVQHVPPSHAVVSKNGRFDVYVVVP